MALSMIYMYLSMSYDWNWLPARWQMWFFAATSTAIVIYLALRLGRGLAVNFLWLRVRDAVAGALEGMTLADLVPPRASPIRVKRSASSADQQLEGALTRP